MPPKKAKAVKAKSKSKDAEAAAPAADSVDAPETAAEQENNEVPDASLEATPTTLEKPDKDNRAVQPNSEAADEKEQTKSAAKSKKRKAGDAAKETAKASRRSIRGAAKAEPSKQQLLSFLLSDTAADLCRPDDEIRDLESRGKDLKTYSNTALSPFEELLCAIVLSRPISHRLGMRTIRTILNKPYNFNTPKAITSLTPEQRHAALDEARTQHKQKTTDQIGALAELISSKYASSDTDTSLDKLRSAANKDWDDERDLLQSSIKGLGKTGLDIFFRRVQWSWPEAYPFVDERTGRGLEQLGLPKSADGLVKMIDAEWKGLDTKNLKVKSDKEGLKRRAFVVVCERATGADLEGKSEALLEAAASS